MPRPKPPGALDAVVETTRANLRRALEDQERGTAWLARHMTEAGVPTSPQVAWKIVNTERAIYVDEAVAISQVLGLPIQELLT